MENKKLGTQSIVEVGIMSGLIIVMFMIINYIPIIGTLFMFVIPIPITILLVKYNIKASISAIVVSTILLSVINNPITAIGNALMFGLTGITMGYCIKNKKTAMFTITLQTITSIISTVIGWTLTIYVVLGSNLVKIIQDQINMMRDMSGSIKQLYEGMGVPVDSIKIFDLVNNITPEFILTLMPGVLIFAGIFTSYVNYIVTKAIMKKLRYSVNDIKPFSTWYIDNRIGVVLIIILISSLIMINNGIKVGSYIFGSFNIIFQLLMIVIGMSIVTFYLKNKFKFKKVFIVLICMFILLNVFLVNIIFFVGVADLALDLRRLDPNSLSNSIKSYLDKKNIK